MKNAAILATTLLALVCVPAVAVGGSFDLRVNDVSGLDEPWSLVGGLPFPEGELRDASQIRIVDADGREVPSQVDVAATWRDGSVRWALAGINASPQGEYRVEFGPGVTRSAPENPLVVEEGADGALTVDTGVAVYEFLPDRLLPESARMGDTPILSGSGDGAYLVDNLGRLSRVAGVLAEVETDLLKKGPARVVVRREGWCVTGDGERVARAKAWFYFAAGSPYLRVTHTLVFTEDTNELWVRDYGLQFRTPSPPAEAVFALSEATDADRFIGGDAPEEQRRVMAEMFSTGLVEREQRLFTAVPGGDEVYMLQEDYPHAVERDFRAVVAWADAVDSPLAGGERSNFGDLWVHPWLEETEVAGDWGEARYGEHALMVVMPQLAQRFPKEIAFGPEGARVAFWSGRSGRDLDFRAVTLVNEYWKQWADNAIHQFGLSGEARGAAIGTRVASQPSNAQGAARTHDVWLLPRVGGTDDTQWKARATAAAHPPLLQADPAWLGGSMAVGWPMHPKDTDRFPEAEEAMSDFWTDTVAGRYGNAELRRAGFIMWGKNVTLGHGLRWFRLSRLIDYSFRNSTWFQYMRTGERRYYDFGRHVNQFAGDLSYAHWTAGDKFRGGFAVAETHQPFYWGRSSGFDTGSVPLLHWPLEYYLTGNEYARDLIEMVGHAYREHWDAARHLQGGVHGHLNNLAILHQLDWDEAYNDIARQVAARLMNMENPYGLNDDFRYGIYYKMSREWLFPLYMYYQASGDEQAREAILRALDNKFRFNHEDWTHTPDGRGPSSDQTYRLFLFSEAYRWTGNRAYLGLIEHMALKYPHFGLMGHNFYQGAPAALHAIARAEEPIQPFPVLAATRDPGHRLGMDFEFIEADELPPIRVRKAAGEAVNLSIYARMPNDMDENTQPEAVVARREPGGDGARLANARVEKEQMFKTKNLGRRDLRRWHLYVTLPEDVAPGSYTIQFPNAATIVVLESDAPEIGLEGE